MMKKFVLLLILFYQKFISPYKGFCCAYHQYTGRASCSGLGYRAIRYYGVLKGVGVLNVRFRKCNEVYQTHYFKKQRVLNQAGHCDLPCDCDLGDSGDACSALADCASGCLDFPSGRRSKKMRPDIYLPPDL